METIKQNFHWYLFECKLSFFSYTKGSQSNRVTGFGWKALYSNDDEWGNDIEIYISLAGNLKGSIPLNLQNKIEEYIKK